MDSSLRTYIGDYFLRGFGAARNELRDCRTILDIGCGSASPYRLLKKSGDHAVGVDLHLPSIEDSREAGIHDDYVQANVLELDSRFEENSFDAVIAFDLIEHLTKEDGARLLASMERIAKKKVLIYTPNGFVPQEPTEDNPYQEHISGWTVSEMRQRGYHVAGAGGWKRLRGEYANIVWKPAPFWNVVSLGTQAVTKHIPSMAFALLCVKRM